jgi:hypothetical protein
MIHSNIIQQCGKYEQWKNGYTTVAYEIEWLRGTIIQVQD